MITAFKAVYDKSTITPEPPAPEARVVFVLDESGNTILNFQANVATCEGSVLGLGLHGRLALITISDAVLDELAKIALARKGLR